MDISLLKCFGKFIFINILLSNITLTTSEVVFLLSVILIELTASSLFAAFINSKPVGRKTALARINVISTHINSITCSILFSFWLVRILLDSGLPYSVVVFAHYWQMSAVSVSAFDNNPYIGSLSSVISP